MTTLDPVVTGRRRGAVAPKLVRRKRAKASAEPPLTLSVPEAGRRYFGLSKNGSYDAASRGEIPTIRIGRLLRVPVRALEAMLDAVETRA
jgi:hypothetical protein